MQSLPKLLEPTQLQPLIGQQPLLIVDLCNDQQYLNGHIPTAVHIPVAALRVNGAGAAGKIPSAQQIEALLQQLGVSRDVPVIAYSDDGGASAGRFAWTLDMAGIHNWSFLNGGLHSWVGEGFPLESGTVRPTRSDVVVQWDDAPRMTKEQIASRLGQQDFLVWDARSFGEYSGSDVRALRGGHIPSAVHLEWTTLLDPHNNHRLRADLADYLSMKGILPNKEIVTHCQTHQRSGLTYVAAKILGYSRIRAYDGSWAEWGNDVNLPVETAL